jgi:hypothetical protein
VIDSLGLGLCLCGLYVWHIQYVHHDVYLCRWLCCEIEKRRDEGQTSLFSRWSRKPNSSGIRKGGQLLPQDLLQLQ